MAHQVVYPCEQQMRFVPQRAPNGLALTGFEILQQRPVGCDLLTVKYFDREVVSIPLVLLDGFLIQHFQRGASSSAGMSSKRHSLEIVQANSVCSANSTFRG